MTPQLTPEILKTLRFTTLLHLNGGSTHSARIASNDEWGVSIVTHTNDSPRYHIIEKKLVVDATEEIEADLTKLTCDFAGFCDRYNEWRKDHPITPPTPHPEPAQSQEDQKTPAVPAPTCPDQSAP